VRDYSNTLETDDLSLESSRRHDLTVANMLEQSVRRASAGARGKAKFRIWFENLVLGDARARGETHQWMWDRVNIRAALIDVGFSDVTVHSWEASDIENWKETGLERTSGGCEYKPNSLYIECKRPPEQSSVRSADDKQGRHTATEAATL